MTLMTDASGEGCSGVLLPSTVSGLWDISQSSEHINWKELKAVQLTILHFLPLLRGKCVSLRIDNLTVFSCVRRKGYLRPEFSGLIQRDPGTGFGAGNLHCTWFLLLSLLVGWVFVVSYLLPNNYITSVVYWT